MKLIAYKSSLLLLMALLMMFTVTPLTAQVYKTVDADGNVTYTDQPPKDGSGPIKLAPISVIETPEYVTAPKESATAEGDENSKQSLKTLRNKYRNFAIVSPQAEESIWHPDSPVSVAWNAGSQLQEGMTVSVSVDGRQQAITTANVVPVPGLDRGEHTVTAELLNASNQKIATAEPVIFFIRRPSVNRPRPRG